MQFALHDETEYRYHLEIQRRLATDDLSGLLTVSCFYERLAAQLERTRRNPGPVVLVMMDVDRLRDVNDAHGHRAGSSVLEAIGALLREQLGSVAELGRYGGDEFSAGGTPRRPSRRFPFCRPRGCGTLGRVHLANRWLTKAPDPGGCSPTL